MTFNKRQKKNFQIEFPQHTVFFKIQHLRSNPSIHENYLQLFKIINESII